MKTFRFMALCILGASSCLFGQDIERIATTSPAAGTRLDWPPHSVTLDSLAIAPAKVHHHGKFSYSDSSLVFNAPFTYDTKGTASVLAGFRNIHTKLSDHINHENILYGVLGLEGSYKGVERWIWTGRAACEFDTSKVNLANRTRYIGFFEGRFAMNEKLGLHTGIYSEILGRTSLIRPVVGFDYTRENWLWQIIYPTKMAVTYTALKPHLFSLGIHPFFTGARMNEVSHRRPATTEYKSVGLEARWDYLPHCRWHFWAAVGETCGGQFVVGSRNFHRRHTYNIKSSPYGQLGISFKI